MKKNVRKKNLEKRETVGERKGERNVGENKLIKKLERFLLLKYKRRDAPRKRKRKMSVTPRLQANSERRQHFLPSVGLFANDKELTRRRAFIIFLNSSIYV